MGRPYGMPVSQQDKRWQTGANETYRQKKDEESQTGKLSPTSYSKDG
ncbi:MAG: hypothetical protein IJ064_06560 [Bacteroidaceae bacterium]|nr:hypothetical protein [Bacteroidaceae bacterium]